VLHARHALIRGLRNRESETELTQAIAAVLSEEPAMAAAFVRHVISRAPHGDRIDVSGLPPELQCDAEQAIAEGRADLSFHDAARRWQIVVELKIYAGYGHEQIVRYLRSLPDSSRAALVAVTRDVPTYGDYEGEDPRWAGSVQWGRVLPGLRGLVPTDDDLRAQWPLFLDVLEEEGSMGFTKANAELFQAWAKYPYARKHLMDFVDSIRRPALDALRAELASAGRADPACPTIAVVATRGKTKKRAVVPRMGKILVGFSVPEGTPERLWIGLWGWEEPHFIVEIPYPAEGSDPAARTASIEALMNAGFESWRDRLLTRYLALDSGLLDAPDLQERVLDFAKSSFALIASSGVLSLASQAIEDEDEVADVT
jgi:hypothetical protein